ncbi:hypothetical protein Droror1_Dr00009236 [Drosera rotundifolia]
MLHTPYIFPELYQTHRKPLHCRLSRKTPTAPAPPHRRRNLHLPPSAIGLHVSSISVVRDWWNMPSIAAQWYSKAMLPMTTATDAPYCNLASFHERQFKHAKVWFDKPKQSCGIYCNKRPASQRQVKKRDGPPQNVDLPPQPAPIKKKKPFPVPLTQILRTSRTEKKLGQMGIETPLKAPDNGLLVQEMIPLAHEVFDAWKDLIRGLAQLLQAIPVYACSECSEVHVAEEGHHIQDCRGPKNAKRRGMHSWVKGSMDDVLVPIESYHLFDPFGRRIKHDTRFNYDRIPAVVELCIQAGVDVPGYPSRRRTIPVRKLGRKVIDNGGYLAEPIQSYPLEASSSLMDLDTHGAMSRFSRPSDEDISIIAQETMVTYETVTTGVRRLMKKYSVKACGYCSEVHVGPWGHNAKLCGAFKHQWRDGKHGWQDATFEEVFPPNYVWHVRDPKGPPLITSLKRFYGKAPAVVEVCSQAGASVPDKYKPMMRVDIVMPDTEEVGLVA